jgi:hypothetical protein
MTSRIFFGGWLYPEEVSAAVVAADWQAAGRLAREISTAIAKEQRKAFGIVMVLFPSVNEAPDKAGHTRAQRQSVGELLLSIAGECTADDR